MELKIDIYDKDTKKVKRTYTAEGYDLMIGTVEDVLEIFDIEKMDDDKAVASMVVKSCLQIKPIVRDIFQDMTDEDFRCIRVADLIPLFVSVCKSILETFKDNRRKN